MDHKQIQDAVGVLSKIVETTHYVSKERFDLAAKVKFNLDDEKRLDRLYGLYNKACQAIHLFQHEDLQQDLFLAVDIAGEYQPVRVPTAPGRAGNAPGVAGQRSPPAAETRRRDEGGEYPYQRGKE